MYKTKLTSSVWQGQGRNYIDSQPFKPWCQHLYSPQGSTFIYNSCSWENPLKHQSGFTLTIPLSLSVDQAVILWGEMRWRLVRLYGIKKGGWITRRLVLKNRGSSSPKGFFKPSRERQLFRKSENRLLSRALDKWREGKEEPNVIIMPNTLTRSLLTSYFLCPL